MTAGRSWRPSTWPLRTTLTASIVLLFALVTAAVAALTVVVLERTMVGQVDQQLRTSAAGLAGPQDAGQADSGQQSTLPGGRRPPPRELLAAPAGGGGALRLDRGPTGEVVRTTAPGTGAETVPSATISYPEGTAQLSDAQVTRLAAVPADASPRTVDLGAAGRYRVVSVTHPARVPRADGAPRRLRVTTTLGLPVDPVEDTVRRTALSVTLLSALGLVLLGGTAAWVVTRSLAPLRRVAATATQVSQVPLSAGETATQQRVPRADTDVRTEVGQVGAALNELLDHVDRALAARHRSEMQVRQFVADASHELRTPLASVKGYAELSRREPEPVPAGVRRALGRIESEADRMTSLVQDLLLLARLDAGRPLERRPVDVTRLALESVSDAHAAGPDHTWSLDLPDAPCEVPGDEDRLRQVLINLLANARRHTPPGTEVTTSVRPDGRGGARVVVRDDGPGIPADLLPHVFERFARGDVARNRSDGSTGLGLSIVRAVMAAHGGEVRLASRPGDTQVVLTLPGAHYPAEGRSAHDGRSGSAGT